MKFRNDEGEEIVLSKERVDELMKDATISSITNINIPNLDNGTNYYYLVEE